MPGVEPGSAAAEAHQALWRAAPGWLNTASYGLPPTPAFDALQAAMADWRAGRVSWEPWGEATERARDAFARLVGVPPSWVATGATVSQLLAPIAASWTPGKVVLAPAEEFTSNLFPYLAQRDATVRTVPAADLVGAIDTDVDVVAFSVVQSSSGAVANVPEIVDAARAVGAKTIADATQAVGWLPVDASAMDVLVCGAYKWLMSPRGTAFATVNPELLDSVVPSAANWFAAEDVHSSYYGEPMHLATDARRLDISPAWLNWVGTAPALEIVEQIGVDSINAHNVALANRFREGLGLAPSNSAIVSADAPDADARLAAAGIRVATRAGNLRASFHIYTTEHDVDTALAALLQ